MGGGVGGRKQKMGFKEGNYKEEREREREEEKKVLVSTLDIDAKKNLYTW